MSPLRYHARIAVSLMMVTGCSKSTDPDCAGASTCDSGLSSTETTTTTGPITEAQVPTDADALSAFLFAHFDDTDTTGLQIGIRNLQTHLQSVDYTAPTVELAMDMSALQGDDLGTIVPPDGVDPAKQVSVALPWHSTHTVDAHLGPIVSANQICIESAATVWAERTFLTDAACFEDRSCEYLEVVNETRNETFLVKVWFDLHKTYRWVTVDDGQGATFDVIIGRAWMKQKYLADGDTYSWDQMYMLDVFVPDPNDASKTYRWLPMWSSITLPALNDDAYKSLVRDGISEAYVYVDEFIDGDIQTCRNDLNYAKPDRP